MDRFKWQSDTFTNYVFSLLDDKSVIPGCTKEELRQLYEDLQLQMAEMHRAHSQEHSVQFHKKRLGKQDFCWQGSGHRFWVWQGDDWIVFANNDHGTSLEVRANLSVKEAIAAFQDYRRKVGLVPTCHTEKASDLVMNRD